MSVTKPLIKKLAKQYVVEARDDQTVQMAVNGLGILVQYDPGATEWNTFLVVDTPDAPTPEERFRVALFCQVADLVKDYPLAEVPGLVLSFIPIPLSTKVYEINTPEAASEIENQVMKSHDQDTFVVYDADGFVCLFANGDLGPGDGQNTFGGFGISATPQCSGSLKTCINGHTRCYHLSASQCMACGASL